MHESVLACTGNAWEPLGFPAVSLGCRRHLRRGAGSHGPLPGARMPIWSVRQWRKEAPELVACELEGTAARRAFLSVLVRLRAKGHRDSGT
eukprot:scaffold109_cov252-Pinguiococcus_pyrenoidosus.AAC.100